MKIHRIISLLFVSLFFIPHSGFAGDTVLERGLQDTLEQSRAVIARIGKKLNQGSPIALEQAALKGLAEEIRAAYLLLRERFTLREERLAGLGGEAPLRHAAVSQSTLGLIDEFLRLLKDLPPDNEISAADLDPLKAFLENLLPVTKPLIFGALPYRNLNYPAREPLEEPLITPAYKGGNRTVTPDDLESTPEAPVSEEIAALAQSLGWNPVSIYEWVKNNVETEWYWGCMKGAEATLKQGGGNDCDQASLLVALLRASNFPSRYVRGVIKFFPGLEVIQNLTGIEDPEMIGEFFRKAGIPFKPLVAGGKVANLAVEHIWVESLIPFANFHGAVVDEHGKAWLGLDTSIKVNGYTYSDPLNILDEIPLAGMRDDYLSTLQDLSPLEATRQRAEAHLEQFYPDMAYEDLLWTKALNPEIMNILPASMQYEQVHITHEYTAIPAELIHQVRFVATGPSGTELYRATFDAPALSNRQLTLQYAPETVEDQEIIDSYGGLDNTPAYLVRLRPSLKVGDETAVVGREGLPIGERYDLTLELIAPNGVQSTNNTHITGNLAVIAIVSGKALTPQSLPDEEMDAARILHEEAIGYIDRWNMAEEELGALMGLAFTRPIPVLVTLGGVMDVSYLLGTPHGYEWKGLYLDADLKVVEPVLRSTAGAPDERLRDFMRLSSLQGSILENRIFEEDLQVESISAAKLFGIANDNGTPILTIDDTNVDDLLSTLPFAQEILEDIAEAVTQGLSVKIPESEIVYGDWTGIGYLKENVATGESGWMLSGMIAGGMTAGRVTTWADHLKEIFLNPHTDPPNFDPTAAFNITKIYLTDRQRGTVGEQLPAPLQVIVHDKNLKPVKGARVRFNVLAGGGSFARGTTASVLDISTDHRGIATANFYLGKRTGDNPIYWWEKGYTYTQQVGENIVEAFVLSTDKRTTTPFAAYGFPKGPEKMRKLSGDALRTYPLSFAGFVSVIIEDEYGNPISNLPVDYAALPAQKVSACSVSSPDTRTRALLIKEDDACLNGFPTWGECQERSAIQVKTLGVNGAPVHLVLGGVPGARYPVRAAHGALSQTFHPETVSIGNCDGSETPDSRLWIRVLHPTDTLGRNINAGEMGDVIQVLARLNSVQEEDQQSGLESLTCATGPKTCPKITGTAQFSIGTSYTNPEVTFAGKPGTHQGKGVYAADYTLSKGVNTIEVKAKAIVSLKKNTCTQCGDVVGEALEVVDTITVYGVDVENFRVQEFLTGNPADVIAIGEHGHTTRDYVLSYTITPATFKAESAYVIILKEVAAGSAQNSYVLGGKEYAPVQYIPSEKTGQGMVTLARGFKFDQNGTYKALVVLNEGRMFENRLIEIWSEPIPLNLVPGEADLDIYKPLVLEPKEAMALIPEADELTVGSVTFVNLDDDDRDGVFDFDGTVAHDSSVSRIGGIDHDDELVKIKLRLRPKDLKKGTVRLTAVSGGDTVKVWKHKDKTSTGEYTPGEPLAVPGTGPESFTVDGDYLVREMWVEGIKAHTAKQETVLEMTYEADGKKVSTDKVALTVVGIDKLEWVGKNNSRNDDASLDPDPTWPTGLLPVGSRVFPDARMVGGGIEPKPRDEVALKVTLSVPPPRPVGLYLRSFDVDDPSSDKGPVDDPGNFWAFTSESDDEDNRGKTTAVPAAGKFSDPVEAKGTKYLFFDTDEKTKKTGFKVTMQPGDNFRVCGGADRDFIMDLSNRDPVLNFGANDLARNTNKQRIMNVRFPGVGIEDGEVRLPGNYCSNTLTVWRFLHVERDSMGVVKDNKLSGNITGLDPPNNTTATKIFVSTWLGDLSPDLNSGPAGNGRFEKGALNVAGINNFPNVKANGRRFVEFSTPANILSTPLPFAAEDNDVFGNATMSGTVTQIVKTGGRWTFQLNITNQSETPLDWDDFKGGTISIGGGPKMPIAAVFNATGHVSVSYMEIPFTLSDDDQVSGDIPAPDTSGMASIYASVYILPLFDTGKENGDAPFAQHSDNATLVGQMKGARGTPMSVDRYWVVSVLNAYQVAVKEDNDPNAEGTSRAFAYRPLHGVVMATESIRDWIASPYGGKGVDPAGSGRQSRYQEILNHEVGHLFGLSHFQGARTTDQPNGGVMNPSCCPPDNPVKGTRGASTFTRESKNWIRKRNHPGS